MRQNEEVEEEARAAVRVPVSTPQVYQNTSSRLYVETIVSLESGLKLRLDDT